jgi:hypothetical protein
MSWEDRVTKAVPIPWVEREFQTHKMVGGRIHERIIMCSLYAIFNIDMEVQVKS